LVIVVPLVYTLAILLSPAVDAEVATVPFAVQVPRRFSQVLPLPDAVPKFPLVVLLKLSVSLNG
jgi:hypothetical protein